MTNRQDLVAIVGAGPAGMMAAIATAECGAQVILLEQKERPGLKLLMTGGGHCNISNTLADEAFMEKFGREGRFMQPALAAMNSEGLCAFLASLDVPTFSPDGFHLYPRSESALQVQTALLNRCRDLKVQIETGVCVQSLQIADGHITGVETTASAIPATRVILATGGRSYPETGATGLGYQLAEQAGHTLVPTVPALVALVTAETWPGSLAGVSLPDVRIRIEQEKKKIPTSGALLFTHTGISGPAVLDISGDVAGLLQKQKTVKLRVNLVPGIDADAWNAKFNDWRQRDGPRVLKNLFPAELTHSLLDVLFRLAGISIETRCAHLKAGEQTALVEHLTALPLEIAGTEGFGRAMVTRGGVSLKQVNPHTLESKLVKGLFFAGELLDLDGPCGGYNLQWAFSSGRLVGQTATE